MKGPGRPPLLQTEEDCRRWLQEELEALTLRYHEKLEHVRRVQLAAELVDELASIYADAAAGRMQLTAQVSLIDDAFARRGVLLERHQLAAVDAPRAMVADEGGPVRFATRVVAELMGVTRYAVSAQRRSREKRSSIVDALVLREPEDEVEHAWA